MFLSIGSLRAQLQRATPLRRLVLNECRFYHTTLPLRAANRNNNDNTPKNTSKGRTRTITEKELMDRLTERTKSKQAATLLNEDTEYKPEEVEKLGAKEEVKLEEEEEDEDLLESAVEEDGEIVIQRVSRISKQLQDRVLGQALEKEKKALVKKVQRRGKWDDNEARAAVDQVNLSTIDNQSVTVDGKKLRTARNNIDIASLRNQKYQVGDQQLSIEDTDEASLKKGKEKEIQEALADHKLKTRKEEVIVADNDPELISVLLDRPSQVQKVLSKAKGEELFEFPDLSVLAEAEEAKGKPKEPASTKREVLSEVRVRDNTRGPKIRKNKAGEDELSLVYDDKPPASRFTLHFKDPIRKLRYFPIYPSKIKTWVHYMKDCKGRYNKWGYWKNDPLMQEDEDLLRDAIKAKAREKGDSGLSAMVDRRKKQVLPLDLEGHYRFGVQPDELIGIHPKIKEMLSFKHANNPEIHAFRTKQAIKRWQERPEDHGTPQVQVACMTNKINYLSDHVKTHKKDHQCKLQLRLLISKRQALLKYLRKKNVPIYYQLVRELDIQDISF